jgi:hypothetical protein
MYRHMVSMIVQLRPVPGGKVSNNKNVPTTVSRPDSSASRAPGNRCRVPYPVLIIIPTSSIVLTANLAERSG